MVKDNSIKKKTLTKPSKDIEKNDESTGIWQDERFQHLIKDPRFKTLPKTERKVKIDKRFQSMFTDDKFKVKFTVDKYGRRVNKTNAEDLRKYYELESGASSSDDNAENEEDDEEKEQRKEEKAISRDAADESAEASSPSDVEQAENDDLINDGEEVPKTLRARLCDPDIDYARGEGRLLTDSSSDDDSTDDENADPVLKIDHVWGQLDTETDMTEESTKRLAVCNMDWDRIRATDLMVLFSSFLPPGGSVLSVKIYPSEYGKERMAEEEQHGPTELVGLGKATNKKHESDSEEEDLVQAQDSDAEEGDDYHMEKLRQYQLNRLRYYYAVVECDSVATADKIYKECDGIEYESSATRVDLRFIPDDTCFDDDVPTDVCTELPDTSSYQPRNFTTTALQQVKVDLTWDETAVERKELGDKLSSGKLDEVNDRDLRKIVAYSSEEDDVDDDEKEEEEKVVKEQIDKNSKVDGNKSEKKVDGINKYRALLAEINEKEQHNKNKKYEMEFSWEIKKEEKNDKELQENEESDEEQNSNKNLTPIEKVLKKRSEKNKKRKEERKRKVLLAKGINPDNSDENSSDTDSLPDGVDLNDPYFAEEFANGDFVDTKSKKKEKSKSKRELLEQEEKEQEKQAQELALLLDDDDELDDNKREKHHFSLDKIQKAEQETKSKKKRRKQLKKSKSEIIEQRQADDDNFELNVNDDRFKNLFTSHLYNIDPTDSHFKKTKGMDKLIQEKLKRRQGNEYGTRKPQQNEWNEEEVTEAKRPKKQLENNILVKSLKRKLQMQQQQK